MTDSRPLARFLFLGDITTDRRVKNFLSFFHHHGYRTELIFATPGKPGTSFSFDHTVVKEIPLKFAAGARMFTEYDNLLKKTLAETEGCEILFSCELYSLRSAAIARKNGKAKQLFYDARELYTELPSVASSPIKKWFWKRWERKGLQATDVVIVTAPDDAQAIKAVHGFIPPAVLIRNFPERSVPKSDEYLRTKFGISPERKIFVYLGGLQQDRGLAQMIDAMKSLQSVAAFVFIGEGPIRTMLQNQITRLNLEHTVFWHAPVFSTESIDILASADVGVSLIEGNSKSYALALPSKVFEYMLAGLVQITSPLKQVRDLLKDSKGLFYASPQSEEEIIGACRHALQASGDKGLRERIQKNALGHFTFDADVKTLLTYLSV